MKTVSEFRNVGSFGKVQLDISKLEAIERELKKHYAVRVGIMGSKATGRQDIIRRGFISVNGKVKPAASPSALTNAAIGLVHEKGSKTMGIPRRSFLEMPLEVRLPKYLNAFGQKVLDGLTTANLKQTYVQLGILAENIVQSAFKTGGFGRWPKLKDATVKRKGSSAILIDTAQLRRSVASVVVTTK